MLKAPDAFCHIELVLLALLSNALLDDMQVLVTPDLWVPLVNLHGVYILPGIPRLFQAMIEAHKEPFRGPTCSTVTLYTNTVEGDLAGKCF